jgi:glutamine phosphoribosylpyrophosphate amidotransferase
MCGITGSYNFDKAFELYQKNLERGSYSSGLLCVRDFANPLVLKQKGAFSKEQLIKDHSMGKEFKYFLFHSRAPTNSTQEEWSEETTHPFKYEYFYVAHNGIITNFKEFEESSTLKVDSSLIPLKLYHQPVIQYVYQQLEGLLTSWIYNSNNQTINVVKAGSSLWTDGYSFSSVQFEGASQIEDDGYIFEVVDNALILKQTFNYNNPYFL